MSKAKILLVEDSRTQGAVAKEFLERNGYEVIWVEDGKSAIRTAKSRHVDLVLLDVELPDINGNEISRWMKVDQDTKGIPIIMLTVKSSVDDKVAGLESGADDYLSKPYNEIELNARIYACLRTKALQDELRQKNRQLEKLLGKVEFLAITDPLTELYNRRRFEAVMEKEFKRAQRYSSPLSCMLIDIDRFKAINDTFGHQAGDSVLKETAWIIRQCIREVDVAARWGGEEFIVLCLQTRKQDAGNAAERIRRTVEENRFPALGEERVTVSIGVAGIPDDSASNAERLIFTADMAMYEAKEKGRNRVQLSQGGD